MQTYITDAINIKTYSISDNDNIVVMFSKDLGLIHAIARGAKRPKSKLGARMQALVVNTLMLDKKRNLDVIKEASAINPFNKLRYDLNKLNCAFYAAEVVNTFCIDNNDKIQNGIIYEIIYKTLNNIQNAGDETGMLLSLIKFQLHFMREIGFGIELERCLKCGRKKTDTVLFSVEQGGIVCPECACKSFYTRLHPKIKDFLIALNKTPLDKKTEFDDAANIKVTQGCFNLLKKYIETISSKKSKAFKVMEETKAG